MEVEKQMMHIGIRRGEVGEYAFVPGCVERAALIAEYFDNPVKIADNREFLTYIGTLDGTKVCVTSTGIGGPSAAIAIEELKICGVHTMVRVGSCASTSPLSHIGDVIVPCGAVRMEGVGEHYLPVEFPAVPDYTLFKEFEDAAKRSGYPYNTGVSITKDSFYSEVSPETMPVYYEIKNKWEAYEKGGATNTCMECAPLFLAGASLDIRTAAVLICATNYNAYSNDDKDYPRDSEQRAIKVAIDGMRAIIARDKGSKE